MKQEFSFVWYIENLSYYATDQNENLFSPRFTPVGLGGTSWSLSLNHYRLSSGFENSVCLSRSVHDAGPENFSLKFEISIELDGSTIYSEECDHTFKKGKRKNVRISLNPNMRKLWKEKNTECDPKDTLCLRCKMWQGSGNVQLVKQYTTRTRVRLKTISFLHRVSNFRALKPNQKSVVTISYPECVFTSILSICNLYTTESVCMNVIASNRNYCLRQTKWFLMDVSGNLIRYFERDYRFRNCALPPFPPKQFILMNRDQYLPNDELSLQCECTFFTGIEYGKIEETNHEIPVVACQQIYSTPQSKNDTKAAEKQSALPSAKEKTKLNHDPQCLDIGELKARTFPSTSKVLSKQSLVTTHQVTYYNPKMKKYIAVEKLSAFPSALEDFKTLYNDKLFTDIVIKTSTKSFSAHKSVLCARSSVFRAMLTSDMREKNTDCIRVDDLENETVELLLLFLYSDSLEELRWESAIQLYYAADKYAVDKLKFLCSSFLVDNLSVSKAGELLLLADTHSDAELKKIVQDFIVEHDEEIFCSEEWEKLNETNSQLVMKTMQLKYKRKK